MVSDMETEASLTTVSLKDVGGITKKKQLTHYENTSWADQVGCKKTKKHQTQILVHAQLAITVWQLFQLLYSSFTNCHILQQHTGEGILFACFEVSNGKVYTAGTDDNHIVTW